MIFKATKVVPIKPNVLRANVEVWEDNFLQYEAAIAVDILPFITEKGEVEGGNIQVEFDMHRFQRHVTDEVIKLMNMGRLAATITGNFWRVDLENREATE